MFKKLVISLVFLMGISSSVFSLPIEIPREFEGTYHAIELAIFENNKTSKAHQKYLNEDIFTFTYNSIILNNQVYRLEAITYAKEDEDNVWIQFKFKGLLKTFDIIYVGADTYIVKLLFDSKKTGDYLCYRAIKRER